MGKLSYIRHNSHQKHNVYQAKDYVSNIRTNLNDLLNKREQEKKIDRKNNLLIITGASAAALVIVAVLSL